MSIDFTLSEVTCPITDGKFTLVRKGIKENVDYFLQWTENVLERAESGKYINIAIDCEGYCLGSTKNSLSCIQIGEIFNDSFNVKTDQDPPNIGSKPGFILITPFSRTIKESITKVFNHPNVMIYTFDFFGDFATIIESGISLQMDNVFDSQLCLKKSPKSFISLKVPGLFKIVQMAKKLDPLGNKAEQEKNDNKKIFFMVSSYLFKDCKIPAQQVLTKDMIIIGSSDVYLTGLAAVYCIKNGFSETVLTQTKRKVDEFKKLGNSMHSILAAPILRHLFFMKDLKYDKDISLNCDNEEQILLLLQHFQNLYYILNGYLILKDNFDCQISFERAKEIYLKIIQKLDGIKSTLVEMMGKNA